MRSSLERGAALAAAAALLVGLAGCGDHFAADVARISAKEQAAAAQAAGAWLAKNAKDAGVKTLPDGLQYRIVSTVPGNGPHPVMGDEVKVNYEGALIDGTVFDSSYKRGQPAEFAVGEVVPAWNEALQMMKPGDVWYLYVPPALGYGPMGRGPVPGNAVMVFKIELISILPHGSSANG
jgi:FKBP-type peptidyl-prolyl cis-trans isomerase